MRTLLGSYLLATLLVTPLAQWLCASWVLWLLAGRSEH